MPKLTKTRFFASLAALGSVAFWALAIPLSKKGFSSSALNPTLFLFARFILATIISFPIIFLIPKNRNDFRKLIHSPKIITVVLNELLGCVVVLGFLYWGVSLTSSIDASVISISYPIFVAIGGAIFLKEKEKRIEVIGLTIAVVGSLFLTLSPVLKKDWDGNLIGNIFVFIQNVLTSAYYLFAKKYYKNLNKWVVTHISFWVGIIGFGAILIYQGHSPIQQLSFLLSSSNIWMFIPIVYMAVFGSIFALTLYYIAQEKLEASRVAFFTYLQPLFSIPAAFLLLHQKIGIFEIIALSIIFFGVYLAEK